MTTEKKFNFLSSQFYLTKMVSVERSELDRDTVLGLIYRTVLNHKKFWKKINESTYAYALYFSLHERWSIQKFKEDDRFSLAEYHNAYWLNVIRSMYKAQHSEDFIKVVLSVAMKDFLAIPYRPKYEVLVPYFSAIIGGRSKHSVQEQALIKALMEEENRCSLLMDEDWKTQIVDGNNIDVAISDLEKDLLGLIVPLLFRQVKIRRRASTEKGPDNFKTKTSLNMNSAIDTKADTNTINNEEVKLLKKNSEIASSNEVQKALVTTVSQSKPNQRKSVNFANILRKYRKVIVVILIVFTTAMIYRNEKSQSAPDNKIDEGLKHDAIQCITLQRKISILQSMESNEVREQLINRYEVEYKTECKAVSHTSKEYTAAINYVSQNSKLISKRIQESIELEEASLLEELRSRNEITNQMVLQAQIYLNRLGYKIVANGHYDTKTIQVVRAFQKRIGVSQTGIVNQKLLTELSSELTLEEFQ